ncbi:photosynthetic NDH subunit of lumenal location 1, chloroplastic [Macadamia integrifolia]|uniref:photosynthetic NDH subunit of lumenal location 1, chloroplastic n=1 Tax=Macadamia integrifolia TaxID=60698 RepID=UPI001C4F913E|nr:photosynthetic NDH subunit of lumenal location 1, chloroplastic [Macadamia integrifolia]
MAASVSSLLSLSWASTFPKQSVAPNSMAVDSSTASRPSTVNAYACTTDAIFNEEGYLKRRPILLGVGSLATTLIPASFGYAEEVPKNYEAFVDLSDGYSYYYPSDWREFDFRGHDSAFKDRYLQLQNVRVSFLPTDKSDIHELGPMDEVISNLVRHKFAAPSQRGTIFDMQERTVNGKNYYTFEYELTSPIFARTAFATISIGNGRYYTLIVGANERRWRRVRNQLKVVADSFKMLDI